MLKVGLPTVKRCEPSVLSYLRFSYDGHDWWAFNIDVDTVFRICHKCGATEICSTIGVRSGYWKSSTKITLDEAARRLCKYNTRCRKEQDKANRKDVESRVRALKQLAQVQAQWSTTAGS